MKKIFKNEFRREEGIVNIGWQKNVEETLGIANLINYGYISGYKDAADDLVEKVSYTSLGESYVFPIVFLYRQYLELMFKNIYVQINRGEQNIKFNHKLDKLWIEIKNNLVNLNANEISLVDAVINEFQLIDSNSTSFRYFWNLDLSATLPEKLSVDLIFLKEQIDKVDSIFYSFHS
jgi:hypothetical protein